MLNGVVCRTDARKRSPGAVDEVSVEGNAAAEAAAIDCSSHEAPQVRLRRSSGSGGTIGTRDAFEKPHMAIGDWQEAN